MTTVGILAHSGASASKLHHSHTHSSSGLMQRVGSNPTLLLGHVHGGSEQHLAPSHLGPPSGTRRSRSVAVSASGTQAAEALSTRGASASGRRTLNAEDLFAPLARSSEPLPEWAQSYVSLLAETTTTAGGMQRHLLRMMAKGAKALSIAHDPLNPLTGALASRGSSYLMKHSPLRSMDDSCAECPPPEVNPMHGRALSLLLSMLMSGAISAAGIQATDVVASAFPQLASMPGMPGANTTELFSATPFGGTAAQHSAIAAQAAATTTSLAADVMQRAPSLGIQGSLSLARAPSAGIEAVIGGAGGMATSTAMKLLRADSKFGVPGLDNVLDSVLDSINESMDDGDHQATTRPPQSASNQDKSNAKNETSARPAAAATDALAPPPKDTAAPRAHLPPLSPRQ